MTIKPFFAGLFILLTTQSLWSETRLSLEGALAWQTRNDQRIPGDSGTKFSFSDFKKDSFPSYRVYFGRKWNDRHELRALYAPLELNLKGHFKKSVKFLDSTFAPDVETKGRYKFNSYRLTYAYHFLPTGDWNFALGFTGKVRDAEVSLTQGTTRESKKNVGFVPLLNAQASTALGANWTFIFDFDGLAAPQGRALDLALQFARTLSWENSKGFFGYRMLEGGADNKEVYNFAWIHYFSFGFQTVF